MPGDFESDSMGDSEHTESVEEKETSESSDEGRAGDLSFWIADDDWVFRSSRPCNPAPEEPRSRMSPQEIAVFHGVLEGVVDETKYYVSVNSLTSVLTVRWKHSERGANWDRFVRSKALVDASGGKKFHSSSSSSLSIHSKAVCASRAKRWCAWHSSWIYDVRPTGLA